MAFTRKHEQKLNQKRCLGPGSAAEEKATKKFNLNLILICNVYLYDCG